MSPDPFSTQDHEAKVFQEKEKLKSDLSVLLEEKKKLENVNQCAFELILLTAV